MRYEVTKEFVFDSAHCLSGEAVYGKCSNVHGHTYKMFITIGSDSLFNGMVINFVDLKQIVNEVIIEDLDHRMLNEVEWLKGDVTTCEVMVEKIFNKLKKSLMNYNNAFFVNLLEVKLYETPTSSATYRG